jgi:hypothetical protein
MPRWVKSGRSEISMSLGTNGWPPALGPPPAQESWEKVSRPRMAPQGVAADMSAEGELGVTESVYDSSTPGPSGTWRSETESARWRIGTREMV